MKTTIEKLRLAESQMDGAIQALRDAYTDAGWLAGDCIAPLCERASELKISVARLAEIIDRDVRDGGLK